MHISISDLRVARSGFTLFELVVSLAVMSVVLALVGPALVPGKSDANDSLTSLISDSRRTATRRAQSLKLDVNAEGEWLLSSGASAEKTTLVGAGKITSPPGSLRMRISPLGICVAESSTVAIHIDPLTCMPALRRTR